MSLLYERLILMRAVWKDIAEANVYMYAHVDRVARTLSLEFLALKPAF